MTQSYMNWFIDVLLEGTTEVLFTLELPSIPTMGSFFTYVPVVGVSTVYKVEKINIRVEETEDVDPSPVDPVDPSIGYAARIQLEVSVVL